MPGHVLKKITKITLNFRYGLQLSLDNVISLSNHFLHLQSMLNQVSSSRQASQAATDNNNFETVFVLKLGHDFSL